MNRRKTLKDLTIKNNFMFGAVMCDEGNCREFLEMEDRFMLYELLLRDERAIAKAEGKAESMEQFLENM